MIRSSAAGLHYLPSSATCQISLSRSETVKYSRFPSVANSARGDGRAGSSNRTSSLGVPPSAGIAQMLARPSASSAL